VQRDPKCLRETSYVTWTRKFADALRDSSKKPAAVAPVAVAVPNTCQSLQITVRIMYIMLYYSEGSKDGAKRCCRRHEILVMASELPVLVKCRGCATQQFSQCRRVRNPSGVTHAERIEEDRVRAAVVAVETTGGRCERPKRPFRLDGEATAEWAGRRAPAMRQFEGRGTRSSTQFTPVTTASGLET
jgi:hypothetical protein